MEGVNSDAESARRQIFGKRVPERAAVPDECPAEKDAGRFEQVPSKRGMRRHGDEKTSFIRLDRPPDALRAQADRVRVNEDDGSVSRGCRDHFAREAVKPFLQRVRRECRADRPQGDFHSRSENPRSNALRE